MVKRQRIAKPRVRSRREELFFRKKVCRLCANKVRLVDYKDIAQLQKFIMERGKIIPPRNSGACARHQRMLTQAIKRARAIALLPFVKK